MGGIRLLARYTLLAVLFITVSLAFNSLEAAGIAGGAAVEVVWVAKLHSVTHPSDLCSSGDVLYMVGSSGSPPDYMFVVEARGVDGRPVGVWSFNPTSLPDELLSCTFHNGRLYVVGVENVDPEGAPGDTKWAIAVFDKDLNLISYTSYNPSPGRDTALLVVGGDRLIYVVGLVNYTLHKPIESYRVEARDPETLKLVRALELPGQPFNAEFNVATGQLWIVGSHGGLVKVDILDSSLEHVKTVTLGRAGECRALAFDGDGNAYIICSYPTLKAKLDRDGNIVKREVTPPRPGFESE